MGELYSSTTINCMLFREIDLALASSHHLSQRTSHKCVKPINDLKIWNVKCLHSFQGISKDTYSFQMEMFKATKYGIENYCQEFLVFYAIAIYEWLESLDKKPHINCLKSEKWHQKNIYKTHKNEFGIW